MQHTKTVLANGVKIITIPLENSPTVSVAVLTGACPLREKKNNSGISHFLEHMCLSGSRKWPTVREVDIQVDDIGAITKGTTYKDSVLYGMKAHSKYAMQITDMICDFFRFPALNSERIEKEKTVIFSEIEKRNESFQEKLFLDHSNLVYGDQPAGWLTTGEKEVIKSISKKQLLSYHTDNYVGDSTTFVIAGAGFDSEDVVLQVKEYFSDLPRESKTNSYFVEKEQSQANLSFTKASLNQIRLIIGFRAYPYGHPDSAALAIIQMILGGSMSSRMFTKIRQEMGACYGIRSFINKNGCFGEAGTITAVAPERISEVMEALMEEYKRIVHKKVLQEEIERAKNLIISRIYMSLENISAYSGWYGWQGFFDQDIISHAQREEQIKAVTAEDIQRVAKEVFAENNLNVSFIGNISDKQKEQLSKIITMNK